MVPQLHMGISIPNTVTQNTPETLDEQMELFFIFSGLRNSCKAPAMAKLMTIQTEELFSILSAE